jgi:HAD superfamily hydrolase (TIGR01509 family)
VIRAIIFDLYGVLAINGWQAFKATHFSGREDMWDQVHQLGRQVDAGESDYDELVRFAAGANESIVRYRLEHTVANEELLKFIRSDLRENYKIGILSNASRSEVIERIFTPGQRALFDTVILSQQIGVTKPDRQAFVIASDEIEVPIGSCLLVDDQERHVKGARKAGMQAVQFTNVVNLKKDLAQHYD